MKYSEYLVLIFYFLKRVLICTFISTRECGLAHKTIVFVLEEFDLFTEVIQSSEEENVPKYICVPITYLCQLIIYAGKTTTAL